MTVDVGLTHVAFAVSDVEASVDFYARYTSMVVVHERPNDSGTGRIVWLSDRTRPFAIVLLPASGAPDRPMGPMGHLGFGVASRAEVDRLAALAASEGRLVLGPIDSGPPVGYWCYLEAPDGHTVEIAHGQEVGLTVAAAAS
jgi:lactoylglutathione lyase